MSLLKDLAAKATDNPILAFLAVDSRDQILDDRRLESIRATVPNVDIRLLVYEEDGIRFTTDFFREEIRDPDRFTYYLCSSPGVRQIVTEAPASLGVTRSAVNFEAFSLG